MSKKFIVGCSPVSSVLWAGKVLSNGLWGVVRHDVTGTAPIAVAQHLLQKEECIEFTHNEKVYKLQVVEVVA